MNDLEEMWKPVVGYEDRYLISNKGNLRSISRTILYCNGKKEFREGVLRKANIISGYRCFLLSCGNSGRKNMRASRMVAMAFIPNPENKPCVDHKDTNKLNDCVENLHWVTYSENNLNPITRKRISDSRKGTKLSDETKRKIGNFWRGKKLSKERVDKMKERAKPVIMFSKQGDYIKEFSSAKFAAKELDICYTHINSCCKGTRKGAGGYMWRYKENWDGFAIKPFIINKPKLRKKPVFSSQWYEKMKCKDRLKKEVCVYNTNGDYIEKCSSLSEAAIKYNTNTGTVCHICKGKLKQTKGFIFKYNNL